MKAFILLSIIVFSFSAQAARREVSGILRYVNGTGWTLLNTSDGHGSENVASITSQTGSVVVNFSFTATEVKYFGVDSDDAYTLNGIHAGASIGANSATIYFSQESKTISTYVYYNGSSWQLVDPTGAFSIGNFSNGVLSLNHTSIRDSCVNVEPRDGGYDAWFKWLGATSTEIVFYSSPGVIATTPSTNMKAVVSRCQSARELTSAEMDVPGSALLFNGVFED